MHSRLILVRHGQSEWNLQNLFSGWTDVDLTEQGRREATEAGQLMRHAELTVDVAYVSALTRAVRTLWLILDALDALWVPIHHDWRLNERHYGALQGLNKAQTAEQYGAEQVLLWRRSYDVLPPALALEDARHPRHDIRYRAVDPQLLPATESLETTLRRVMQCWEQLIAPALRNGQTVLLVAHGNSLRALVKHLKHISAEDIMDLNIPTGAPWLFEFDARLRLQSDRYLGDAEAIAKAAAVVAAQAQVSRST